MLNMTDIFQDIDDFDGFSERIQRIIFFEEIDNYGRPFYTKKISTIQCVVTVPQDAEIKRWVDSTSYSRVLCFTSTTSMNADTQFTDGDELRYKGNYFKIIGVDDYSSFGYNRTIAAQIELHQSKTYTKT